MTLGWENFYLGDDKPNISLCFPKQKMRVKEMVAPKSCPIISHLECRVLYKLRCAPALISSIGVTRQIALKHGVYEDKTCTCPSGIALFKAGGSRRCSLYRKRQGHTDVSVPIRRTNTERSPARFSASLLFL